MPESTEELKRLLIQTQRELWQARMHIAQRELLIIDIMERDMQNAVKPNGSGAAE